MGLINPSKLTIVRDAVWNMLDTNDYTKGQFKQRFYFGDANGGNHLPPNVLEMIPSAIADLPSIAIWPLGVTPRWYVFQSQLWPYFLGFESYTPDWHLPTMESVIESVNRVVYSERLIGHAAGIVSRKSGPAQVTKARLGKDGTGPKATKGAWSIAFEFKINPLEGP